MKKIEIGEKEDDEEKEKRRNEDVEESGDN